MRSMRSFRMIHPVILILPLQIASIGRAQSNELQPASPQAISDSHVEVLSSGIEVQAGELRERVVALRDDVLRVTFARGGAFPEDASWAVLPDARHSTVPVTADTGADRFGFHTAKLIVEVDKGTLQLTVRDLDRQDPSAGCPPNPLGRRRLPHLQIHAHR